MNKAELIDVLTEKLGSDRRTATDAVEHVVDTIVRAVHRGESVTITGFGVFEQRRRAARVARNPRTGETVKVKPTSVPAFRPGAQFKAVIAGGQKLPATGPAVKRGVAAPATKAAAKKGCCQEDRSQEGSGQEGSGQDRSQEDGCREGSRQEGSGQDRSQEDGCHQGSRQEGSGQDRSQEDGCHQGSRQEGSGQDRSQGSGQEGSGQEGPRQDRSQEGSGQEGSGQARKVVAFG